MTLYLDTVGPQVSVQDGGRPGCMALGISRGGTADRQALIEAAALLGLRELPAAVEMAGLGGAFRTDTPCRIALTGASMTATIDDTPAAWNATHLLLPGQSLRIGGARAGVYGYLTPAGGIETPKILGSRSAHPGLGDRLVAGDILPVGADGGLRQPSRTLTTDGRFGGGEVRVLPGPQTALFPPEIRRAILGATFVVGPRTNRQATELRAGARPWSEHRIEVVSDVIIPGDIQITGDGTPFVLLAECQTIGGYPRIGTVHPSDLPRIAQAPVGSQIRFVEVEHGSVKVPDDATAIAAALRGVRALVRDPAEIGDLLSYQLVGGVTAGDELDD
ncbi:biotin-dependent carboxylase uncharacterized domain-containing protein [Poseidonocella pacifica]|uniref:Biotin-dependent carboxylase uncharacterized domain-containing protein n=1 Tax=Poseidonocella pacifica TaxID=871651 RepID=A0A1I0YEK8_9RHOB|nr:biotin-dependent carboxyltransferase family protein [Poseidonocella pacifica]SFB11642.1 biotin-dependent carboxylase uncharacterized domain-containing protein [Poseidonocella pacifica]